MERHAAKPATHYRYRARESASGKRPAGPWSGWSRIRTPPDYDRVPRAPHMLPAQEAPYKISLRWRLDDTNVDGFVLERCATDDSCFIAALLNPDEREFDFHTLKAGRYRITAFNAHGYSRPSDPTPSLGTDVPLKADTQAVDLGPVDSRAASKITRMATSSSVENAECTSPRQLIAEGWKLVGVAGEQDLYRDPSGCGTGGCVYSIFTTNDGCYATAPDSAVLTTTPPFSGKDDDSPGMVVTNSSGSAGSGVLVIYQGTSEVDRHDWKVVEPPYVGKFPPFGDYGSTQMPEGAQIQQMQR
jgi:hypothetical protein